MHELRRALGRQRRRPARGRRHRGHGLGRPRPGAHRRLLARHHVAWVLDVNLLGVVHGVTAFVPLLLEAGVGHVVNTASSAGLGAGFGAAAYAASKHAVVAYSEALANDLAAVGSPVGVSVLCPEAVRTRIHESARLRPADVTAPSGAYSEAMGSAVATLTVGGADPAVVAGQVLDAVAERRFYVLTDPERTLEAVRVRFEAILDGAVAAGRPAGTRPAVAG